jgi:phosphatidylglycerophosphate synthase
VAVRPALPVKERDAVWTTYVVDPLAAPLVARLRAVAWITPNRLTVASAIVALGAAAAFALGPLWVGAILFQLSFLLDCMDGKLAAARGEDNPLGGLYDVIGDCIRLAACATGLAVGLDGAGEAALVAAYVGIRFSVITVAEARPGTAPRGTISIPAGFGPFLRAAPRRSGWPGTTVDTEAVAFTLGPLCTVPVIGVAVAAAVDLLHLLVYVFAAVRDAMARS